MLHKYILVLEILLGLAACRETNDCCQTKLHGGATYQLRDVDTTLPECHDNCVYEKKGEPGSRFCFKSGGISSSTCGIGDSFETSDLMMQLEDLKTIVQQNGCPGSNFEPKSQSASSLVRKQTQMEMAKTQSDFFRNLTDPEQEEYLFAYQNNGGIPLPEHCQLDKMKQCNANKTAIDQCFDVAVAYSNISSCLSPACPGCAVALTSFLGFDVNTQTSTRFIAKNNVSSVLGNILITPYAIKEDPAFDNHMYIDGNGYLQPTITYANMTDKLAEHKTYWEAKLGTIMIMSETQVKEAGLAKTMVDTGDKLVDVISKTKALFLDDLDKSIKAINVNIEGITAEAKKDIEEALALLYTSEVKVQNTRAQLEILAKDTIERVNSMLHYLSLVKDDWEAEKIAKFMKFQAKEMTSLVERSLTLIKDAEALFEATQENMANIQAELESFNQFMTNLANTESQAFKDRKASIRKEVYLPCCIPCPPCCIVCAVTLETKIGEWQKDLNRLITTINNNVGATTKLIDEAIAEKETLGDQVKSLITWGEALHSMSEVDWTFPEAEIFGFADIRPDITQRLVDLKNAAISYLETNSKKE